jgi:aspartyl-tRNA(Asn)/glutamyl-tRNA(Gln) amidotransferase subunit A
MYLADANTVPVNLANLPAISVPAGETDGLPVGLQLVGPAFGERTLVRAGSALA